MEVTVMCLVICLSIFCSSMFVVNFCQVRAQSCAAAAFTSKIFMTCTWATDVGGVPGHSHLRCTRHSNVPWDQLMWIDMKAKTNDMPGISDGSENPTTANWLKRKKRYILAKHWQLAEYELCPTRSTSTQQQQHQHRKAKHWYSNQTIFILPHCCCIVAVASQHVPPHIRLSVDRPAKVNGENQHVT